MLGMAQYHTIPRPKGWPGRVDSAVIRALSVARVARGARPHGIELGCSAPVSFVGPLQATNPDPW